MTFITHISNVFAFWAFSYYLTYSKRWLLDTHDWRSLTSGRVFWLEKTEIIQGIFMRKVLGRLVFPDGTSGEESACWCWRHKNHGVPSLGWKDRPGRGNGNLLSNLAWKIPWTGGWRVVVHGTAESWTQLCDWEHIKQMKNFCCFNGKICKSI